MCAWASPTVSQALLIWDIVLEEDAHVLNMQRKTVYK